MAGVFPTELGIYIVSAGTSGSALASSDKISGEVTNWKATGGSKDVETIPVFGGFVDKEKPQEQYEVSMDVIVQNTSAATLDRYEILKFGSGQTSATTSTDRAIFISGVTGTLWKTLAFNNCNVVTWEPEMSADDMLRGTITFKLSPQTPLGAANVKSSACAYSTSFFNW